MNKYLKYGLIIGGILLLGTYFGYEIASLLSLAGLNEVRKDIKNTKDSIEDKKVRVEEADDNIEEDHFNNADNAGNYVDDVLSDISTDKWNEPPEHSKDGRRLVIDWRADDFTG